MLEYGKATSTLKYEQCNALCINFVQCHPRQNVDFRILVLVHNQNIILSWLLSLSSVNIEVVACVIVTYSMSFSHLAA